MVRKQKSLCESTEYFDKIEMEFYNDPQDFYPFEAPKPIKPIKVITSKNTQLDERAKFAWDTLEKYYFSVDIREESKRDEGLQKVIQELEGYNARARY